MLKSISNESFGRQLKRLRRAKGLNQTELGVAIGVKAATVSRWEKGLIAPTVSHVQRAADVLGVPVTAFEEDEVSSEAARGYLFCRNLLAQLANEGLLPDVSSPAFQTAITLAGLTTALKTEPGEEPASNVPVNSNFLVGFREEFGPLKEAIEKIVRQSLRRAPKGSLQAPAGSAPPEWAELDEKQKRMAQRFMQDLLKQTPAKKSGRETG